MTAASFTYNENGRHYIMRYLFNLVVVCLLSLSHGQYGDVIPDQLGLMFTIHGLDATPKQIEEVNSPSRGGCPGGYGPEFTGLGTRSVVQITTPVANIGSDTLFLADDTASICAPDGLGDEYSRVPKFTAHSLSKPSTGDFISQNYKNAIPFNVTQYITGSGGSVGEYGDYFISPGWLDVYSTSLFGNWVDVTGQPEGEYTVELIANPFESIDEDDYENNSAWATFYLDVSEGEYYGLTSKTLNSNRTISSQKVLYGTMEEINVTSGSYSISSSGILGLRAYTISITGASISVGTGKFTARATGSYSKHACGWCYH